VSDEIVNVLTRAHSSPPDCDDDRHHDRDTDRHRHRHPDTDRDRDRDHDTDRDHDRSYPTRIIAAFMTHLLAAAATRSA